MQQKLGLIALVVRDYDDAIAFYTQVLGFDLIEDTPIPEQQKRWVVVAPHGANGSQILLARAVGYGNLWDLLEPRAPGTPL